MGSEQHTASLKNRLYKQKNPGRFTPSGVFFISALPPHGAGCRPQGFAAAAAGRRGRRRCNTTQRQTRPVPESAEKSGHSAPCAVCAALLSVHPAPACPAGAAPSGHLPGPPCRIFASLSPPPAANRKPPGGSYPAATKQAYLHWPPCAPSSPSGCPETARCPRRAPDTRLQSLHPQGAALPAHG